MLHVSWRYKNSAIVLYLKNVVGYIGKGIESWTKPAFRNTYFIANWRGSGVKSTGTGVRLPGLRSLMLPFFRTVIWSKLTSQFLSSFFVKGG